VLDTGVAFSQIDWNGTVIATSPSDPDVPALRRAQPLTCSGVIPEAMAASRREVDTARILTFEAPAAALYWQLWKDVPIRFARRNPQRLGSGGRWQPGRLDSWLVFGSRASLLTGQPYRASTPGNAVLNWLYAICQSELTFALRNAGIDPGIGLFHVDMPNRPSLALDAIEALRPYVDLWLFGYLVRSAFANRDFTELRDGEVRLTHPLNAHLAHTAALWRQLSEPIADWLKESFTRAAETTLGHTQQWVSQDGPSGEPVIRKRRLLGRSLQQRQALRPPARHWRRCCRPWVQPCSSGMKRFPVCAVSAAAHCR